MRYLVKNNAKCNDLEELVNIVCYSSNSKIPDVECADLNFLLEKFREEQKNPLIEYLSQEVEFRLKEFHGIPNPREDMVDNIALEISDRLEEIVDFDNLDKIIKELLHK